MAIVIRPLPRVACPDLARLSLPKHSHHRTVFACDLRLPPVPATETSAMLVLTLQVGQTQYALPVSYVREVVPLVELKQLPFQPQTVAGLFTYRGDIVPVIDICQLTSGTACPQRLSSRIVLIDFPTPDGLRVLGLLAEQVTDTRQIDPAALRSTGLSLGEAPYLGEVAIEGENLLQLLIVENLLPPSLRQLVFAQTAEHD